MAQTRFLADPIGAGSSLAVSPRTPQPGTPFQSKLPQAPALTKCICKPGGVHGIVRIGIAFKKAAWAALKNQLNNCTLNQWAMSFIAQLILGRESIHARNGPPAQVHAMSTSRQLNKPRLNGWPILSGGQGCYGFSDAPANTHPSYILET